MSQAAEKMWAALRDAGLVQGAAPELGDAESPWFVKVLLAFSGWLAAVFLLGFFGVALASLVESKTASAITGILMIGGAFALLRTPKNEFVEHLALAVSLAGQALVIFAIFRAVKGDDSAAWALVAVFEAILAAVMPNFVHRVFSAFIAASSLAVALALLRVPYLSSGIIMLPAAWLWLHEFRFPGRVKILQSVAYGLVLAVMVLQGATALGFGKMHGYEVHKAPTWVQPWMGELLAAGILLYVVWSLLQRHAPRLSGRTVAFALAGTAVLCAASLAAKGLAVGTAILLLGFAGGNRVLLGLGVASLLFYISSYYYTLEATLLAKAQTLLIAGLVLLAARWFMTRFMPAEREAQHG